jgi:hypothetical protein
LQLEEDLADDLKWSMLVKEVLFSGKSEYQEVDLIHTGPFGKVREGSRSSQQQGLGAEGWLRSPSATSSHTWECAATMDATPAILGIM